jgi:hypothetical protein
MFAKCTNEINKTYQLNRHLIKVEKADQLADWHRGNISGTWKITLVRYKTVKYMTYFESLKYVATVEKLVPESKCNKTENVGFEVFTAVVMKSIIFWDVTPCSLLSYNRRFGGTPAYLLVLAEIISSTLKMEAICSSETSVATQQTTWRHIPEDDTLQNRKCYYETETL